MVFPNTAVVVFQSIASFRSVATPTYFLASVRFIDSLLSNFLFQTCQIESNTLFDYTQAGAPETWVDAKCQVTGIACMLLLMIGAYIFHFPTWVVCFFYLLRTSFMNATSALTKSVLMDAVPKHERAKWSALESVNMFSWSGSAAIGGLLVGYKGIIFNFLVTGSVQFLATLPLVLLFSREGREAAPNRRWQRVIFK